MNSVVPVENVRVGGGRMLCRGAVWGATGLRYGAAGAADSLWRWVSRRKGRAPGGRLTGLLVALGPTFIKGGQLLSTRHDLVRPAVCETLGRLHDRVAPMDRRDAESVLAEAYGTRWPFEEFDWTAVASGSIACVYRASLRDGRAVAVKVRRPRIRDRMHADFALLGMGARAMQRLPGLRKVPAGRMVDQIGHAVLRQLDLSAETESLAKLAENLRSLGYFRVPGPLPEYGGEGVLVMEYIAGLGRFAAGERDREGRRVLVRRVLRGVFQMLFLDGLVHCDMHPGNLYLSAEGDVVLLDAGFVVQLEPKVQRRFAEFFLNMSLGRGGECAEVVLASSEHVPPDADLAAFRAGIVELVGTAHRRTAGQFRLAPFATRLFDLQRRCGIAAAPEFVFPLVSLLVLEGMINELDTDVDFQGEAIPILLTALNR